MSNLYQSQLAALISHGTNLGIAAMGHSAEGITPDMLQHVSRFFLTDATLKAANAAVVSFHHRLGFSGLWGTGTTSFSDGQCPNVAMAAGVTNQLLDVRGTDRGASLPTV